jgi:hypothetical protein
MEGGEFSVLCFEVVKCKVPTTSSRRVCNPARTLAQNGVMIRWTASNWQLIKLILPIELHALVYSSFR